MGFYRRCLVGLCLLGAQAAFANDEPITLTTQGAIPAVAYVNKAYTLTYTLNNTLGFDMPTPLTIEKQMSSNDFVIKDGCSGLALKQRASCQVQIVFTASQPSEQRLRLTMAYAHYRVPFSDIRVTAKAEVVLEGKASLPLAANIAIGIAYPVQLTFTNTSANLAATHLHFLTNVDPAFTVNTDTCQSLTRLAPGKSCYLSGELRPTTESNHTVAATLQYAEGQPVTASTSGNAEKVVVTGEATQKLEPNIAVGIQYPVQLVFTNLSNHIAATNLTLTTNFPAGFTQNKNTCTNKTTLAANGTCEISGDFKSNKNGPVSIKAILNYKEGQPVAAETNASAENVVVEGETNSKLPNVIAPNFNYPIKFIFTNKSTNLSATGLTFSNVFPAGFHLDKDECTGKTSLKPNLSCSVSGYLNTKETGPLLVGMTLRYKEGQPVSLKTETNAKSLKLVSTQPVPTQVRFGTWLKFYMVFNRKVESGEFKLISTRVITNGSPWTPNNASQFYTNDNIVFVDIGMNVGKYSGN